MQTSAFAADAHPSSRRFSAVPGGNLGAPINADLTLTDVHRRGWRHTRVALGLLGLVTYAFYLSYRIRYTLNPDALVFSWAVLLAEVHGFFSFAFYFFQVRRLRGRRVPAPASNRTVDVFVTTYNEDPDLLRQTLRAAVAMRYPHRTWVLDDGRRPAVRALAEELACGYLTRDGNEHAKAGNWNNAFAQTSGELIATFDADHVPRADFLERTLGFFRDPKVAFVQTPQRYHNLDSLQHRVNQDAKRLYGEQDVFFNLVLPGKEHTNSAFFCGTGAVLRRSALVPHGGLLVGSITEDMHTSLALHAEGWKSVYVNELLVTGLAPMDFRSFQLQRLRWAEGNLKIAHSINPLTCRGLSFAQRISYFASMWHWTIGLAKLVFYVAPPLMLFTGLFPIVAFDRAFLMVYAAHLATLVVAYQALSGATGRLIMDELFNMASVFTLVRAVSRCLVGRRPGVFVVTDKRRSVRTNDTVALPHYVLAGFSILALAWSWMGFGFGATDDLVGIGIASFWALYNLGLVLAVIAMAERSPQKRQSVRFKAAVAVEWSGDSTRTAGVTADLSEGGCTLMWPYRIPVGTRGTIVLHLGPRPFSVASTVVSQHGRRSGWYAYGVNFAHENQQQVDLLADALYNMTVPEMFARLSQPPALVRVSRHLGLRLRGRLFRRQRTDLFLPVRTTVAGRECLGTTRDIGPGGLSIAVPLRPAPGALVDIEVVSPEGGWRARGTVRRTCPMPRGRAEFQTWLVGLSIEPANNAALDRFDLAEAQ